MDPTGQLERLSRRALPKVTLTAASLRIEDPRGEADTLHIASAIAALAQTASPDLTNTREARAIITLEQRDPIRALSTGGK